MFWIILFALIVFMYICDLREFENFKRQKNVFCIFILIMFILYSGLRFRVGIDTIRYMESYDLIPSIFEFKQIHFFLGFEPLWLLICSVLKSISSSFTFLQFFHAIVLNSIILYIIQKNTKYVFSTLFLYLIMFFFLFNFETIRESLSISIFLLSIGFYFNKKWLLFYSVVTVCFFIHYSAIFLFLLPLTKSIKLNKLSLVLSCFLGIIFYICFSLNLFQQLDFSFLGELFTYKAKVYFDRPPDIGFYIIIKNIILPLLLVIIGLFNKKRSTKYDSFVFLYVFLCACSMFVPIFVRLSNYFILFYILFVVDFCFYFAKKIHQIKLQFPVLLFLLLFSASTHLAFYFTKIPNTSSKCYHRYFPYSSIFTKKEIIQREMIYLYEWDYE